MIVTKHANPSVFAPTATFLMNTPRKPMKKLDYSCTVQALLAADVQTAMADPAIGGGGGEGGVCE